jgi:2'-hydroxyisoflavone reductase
VSEDFLTEQKVEGWSQMPLWVPESDPSNAGFFAFDNRKATTAGLDFRPLPETVRATLEWDSMRSDDRAWRAGLTREREAELLAAWRSSGATPVASPPQ